MQSNKELSKSGNWLDFFVPQQVEDNAARAEGQSLGYVLQARLALDGSGYLSQHVQFNVSQFVNCTTRLFAENENFAPEID